MLSKQSMRLSEENSNPYNCWRYNSSFIFPSVTPYDHTDAPEPVKIYGSIVFAFPSLLWAQQGEMLDVLNNNLQIHIQRLGQINKK